MNIKTLLAPGDAAPTVNPHLYDTIDILTSWPVSNIGDAGGYVTMELLIQDRRLFRERTLIRVFYTGLGKSKFEIHNVLMSRWNPADTRSTITILYLQRKLVPPAGSVDATLGVTIGAALLEGFAGLDVVVRAVMWPQGTVLDEQRFSNAFDVDPL